MIRLAHAASLGMVLSLAACGNSDTPPATAPANAAALQGAEQNPMTAEPDPATVALQLPCGTATASLHRTGPASLQAQIQLPGQPARPLAIPDALAEQSALGLGCTTASDGAAFLVVQYGELPYGCRFCEWYALYDAQGQLLTQNTPALLGLDEQREPNNTEYDALLARHGLQHPAMEFAGN